MIGFIVGTLCLIGLIATLRAGRRRRWARHHGYGYGGHEGFGGGRGPRWFLRRLFEELGTSPSQEKVIVSAVEEVRAAAESLKGEVGASRSDVAQAIRNPAFTGEALGELFGRHDESMKKMREAVTGAFAKVHEVLDDGQRAILARYVEQGLGRRWGGRGGPYRNGFAI